jgi:putative lipase involved disintegration of autophagic bodies
MKITAVEWLAEQVEDYIGLIPIDIINQAKQMEAEEQDKIYDHAFKYGQLAIPELSDEEIRKAAIEYANNVYDKNDFKDEWRGVLNDFIAATKWYREQLKSKQWK